MTKRARVNVSGLNFRAEPSLTPATIISVLRLGEIVEIMEDEVFVNRFGYDWVRVSYSGRVGYVVKKFLSEVKDSPATNLNKLGINIDPHYGVMPPLKSEFKYIRFPFRRARYENGIPESFDLAFSFYDPIISSIVASGKIPILVLDHTFYGEGAGFNWDQMDSSKWSNLRSTYLRLLDTLIHRYRNTVVYQIWNEQDLTSSSAVGMPAEEYVKFLNPILDRYGSNKKIITGGFASGNVLYWDTVYRGLREPNKLSGASIHPYGHFPNTGKDYTKTLGVRFGYLKEIVNRYYNKYLIPIWLTEWGVTGDSNLHQPPNVPETKAAEYVRDFVNQVNLDGRVVASTYFAYQDGQHNTYGFVDKMGNKKPKMFEALQVWYSPVGGSFPPLDWKITNPFLNTYILGGKTTVHTGIDIDKTGSQDVDAPIFSIYSGEVLYASDGGGTWLGLVLIRHDHDNTFTVSRYAHLDPKKISVKVGDRVFAGQIIGFVGNTKGRASFEPHLHFDLFKTGDVWSLDPNNFRNWFGNNVSAIKLRYQNPVPFLTSRVGG